MTLQDLYVFISINYFLSLLELKFYHKWKNKFFDFCYWMNCLFSENI